MRVSLPTREPLINFVKSVGPETVKISFYEEVQFANRVQLTPLEIQAILRGSSDAERISRFFWIWTLKEAYTKALGIGLGFDFRRIEFDPEQNKVTVDRVVPEGWEFSRFELVVRGELYQGFGAEFVGGEETVFHSRPQSEWIKTYQADILIKKAIESQL